MASPASDNVEEQQFRPTAAISSPAANGQNKRAKPDILLKERET
jgi:hypothetical protein